MNATVIGDVLTIEIHGESCKVRLPKGERGPPGRDGISIRGDQGPQGEKGETGRDGRDSVIPGPQGPMGHMGVPGITPKITVGQVLAGEAPAVFSGGTPENVVLDFVLPRGPAGAVGPAGKDGKNGNHEIINVMSFGNSPAYNNMMLGCYIIADGVLNLPDMTEAEVGRWIHIKTFDRLSVTGLVESGTVLDKNNSAKFVVIAYGDGFRFTRF